MERREPCTASDAGDDARLTVQVDDLLDPPQKFCVDDRSMHKCLARCDLPANMHHRKSRTSACTARGAIEATRRNNHCVLRSQAARGALDGAGEQGLIDRMNIGILRMDGWNLRRGGGLRNFLGYIEDACGSHRLLHRRFRLPKDVELETIGAAAHPLWAGPAGWQTACHNKSVLDAILTSDPYPVRGMYVSGVNIAVMYPDTRRTLEALRSLDFLCVAAHTMTPTAAVADLVLPKTTTLEEEEVDVSQTGACVTYTAPASARIGEVRCDMEIASGLIARMRDRGALTAELLPWRNQADFNRFMIGDAPIDQVALRRDGFVEFPYELGNFSAQVFRTPSGKIEVYSSTLAKLGLDPLPDHVTPLYERATALVSADFPLVLQTGQREKTYHHSRFREQSWARKVSPDPTIRIHPETAAKQGLVDGAWIIVETEAGPAPCRLRAEITDRTAPNVVTTGIGWWRPEAVGPEFAALDININAALTYSGPMDPMSGSVDTRALPCRLLLA